MERYGEYNTLRVTPEGRKLLKGEVVPRLLKAATRKEKPSKTTTSEAASWQGVDTGLFEELRVLRRQIATEHNVPPFIIFSDTTLRDLARRRPTILLNRVDLPTLGRPTMASSPSCSSCIMFATLLFLILRSSR